MGHHTEEIVARCDRSVGPFAFVAEIAVGLRALVAQELGERASLLLPLLRELDVGGRALGLQDRVLFRPLAIRVSRDAATRCSSARARARTSTASARSRESCTVASADSSTSPRRSSEFLSASARSVSNARSVSRRSSSGFFISTH
jgi:hypothetical protein